MVQRSRYCKQCGNEVKRVIVGNMNPYFCGAPCRVQYAHDIDLRIRRIERGIKREGMAEVKKKEGI